MLQIRNLRVEKAGKTICRVPKLDVTRGEQVGVIGPNGSGKTTLLRVVSGLESKCRGECRADVPPLDRVYVHQAPYLFRGTVLFNTLYGLAARQVPRRERLSLAQQWLNTLGIRHLAQRRSTSLSGGERRRVALARAFAIQPAILLLDEPFADLDQEGIELVCGALATAANSTVLIASPIPLPESLKVRSLCLEQNRLMDLYAILVTL